jgi:sirohydrochlorin cobaltochelatase
VCFAFYDRDSRHTAYAAAKLVSTGLVLFCHGARDARWREPFDRLRAMIEQRFADPVELAFLESMSPDLNGACTALVEREADSIVVVPLFLGTGGHLRRDLPPLIAAAQANAGVAVTAVTAAGEDDGVLTAIADYCIRAIR